MRTTSNPPKGKPTGFHRTVEEVKTDSSLVGFGQYKNKTWNDVAEINPSYIVWCYEKVTNRTLCSKPLAVWCGYVDKTTRAPAVNQTGDDIDLRDIPKDDVPF